MYRRDIILSFFTPVCRLLPLRQLYQGSYNAGGTALLQVPTLQKLLLLQIFLAPPQVTVAFVAFYATGATYALLHLGS